MDELAAKRPGEAAPGVAQRGQYLQAAGGPLRRRADRGVRPQGRGDRWSQVSEKHAGFVVNRGGATADDVRRLMALVQETVLRETGVALEPEVRLLGF